jgi:hypothetical protein
MAKRRPLVSGLTAVEVISLNPRYLLELLSRLIAPRLVALIWALSLQYEGRDRFE